MVATAELRNYAYLQVLDLLTTLVFLLNGIQEGNPAVRLAMHASGNPVLGLILVKFAALGFGYTCWRLGRVALLSRANWFFALLIVWNLTALLLASSAR